MGKIERKPKIFYLIFGIIDILLLATTVFLLVAALLFRGGSAPALFGHYVFLAETDAFSAVKKGSALIVDPVELKSISPGNIIIFTDEEEENDRIGEVQDVASDGGIYTFTVRTDADFNITVGQSHIVGKGIYYSEFLGAIVSFVTSPAGVCLIAILPCAAFVIFEIAGIVKRKAPQPNVETVKKQYETPTYIPPGTGYGPANEEERPAFPGERQRLVEAAGLFTPPVTKKPEPPKTEERTPISGRDIDKLIKETKARHERESFATADAAAPRQRQGRAAAAAAYRTVLDERPSIEITDEDERPHAMREEVERPHTIPREAERPRTVPGDVERPRQRAEEPAKQYASPKVKYVPRVARLDSLLREDSADGDDYDIEDILSRFDSR